SGELNVTAAALRVAAFSGKDRFLRRTAASIALKVAVADKVDQSFPQCVGRTGKYDIAPGICGSGFRQFIPLLVDNSFPTDDHHILLKIVEVLHAIDETFDIDRMLG